MEVNSVSSSTASTLLSSINPNAQSRADIRQTEQDQQTQGAQQSRVSQRPQQAQNGQQTQNARQTQRVQAPQENEASERVRTNDERSRPTVNAQGQRVGARINITA